MNVHSPLDCGSGCRGFDTRHSPEITAETPSAISPLVALGDSPSTRYSPDSVQQSSAALSETPGTEPVAAPVLVPLGHGFFALVDAVDAVRVLAKRWHVWRKPGRPDVVYAQHTFRHKSVNGVKGKTAALWLHRFVLAAEPGQIVDHSSGNPLDCRRSNLRLATSRQNSQNVTSSKRQKRGELKGVYRLGDRWFASIRAGDLLADGRRKQVRLGPFSDPESAGRAYDAAAVANFGEFASLNFDAAYTGDQAGARAALSDMAEALTPTPAVSR